MSQSRYHIDLGSRAELVYQARTRLMAAGLTNAEIGAVLIDGPLVNQARVCLLRAGLSDAEIAAVLVDDPDSGVPANALGTLLGSILTERNPNTASVDLTAATGIGSLLRSTLASPREAA